MLRDDANVAFREKFYRSQHSQTLTRSSSTAARRLFAARFLRRFGINNSMTIIFAHSYVNAEGILILDLKKTIAVPPRKRYTIGL